MTMTWNGLDDSTHAAMAPTVLFVEERVDQISDHPKADTTESTLPEGYWMIPAGLFGGLVWTAVFVAAF